MMLVTLKEALARIRELVPPDPSLDSNGDPENSMDPGLAAHYADIEQLIKAASSRVRLLMGKRFREFVEESSDGLDVDPGVKDAVLVMVAEMFANREQPNLIPAYRLLDPYRDPVMA